jgi:hypothetical protein
LLYHLGKPAASVRELDVGYRVPRQILDFASRLLPAIAPDLSPAKSLRADPNALALVPVPSGELGERVAQGCVAALAGLGSVAVICADADVQATAQALRSAGLAFTVLGADGGVLGAGGSVPDSDRTGQSEISETADRLTLVPVTLAKGLEFDHVVLVEPGRIATGEAYGLRRLYVALTRAVSRLTVFHAEPLPAELSLHTIRAAFELGPFGGRRSPRASQPGVGGLFLGRRLRDQHWRDPEKVRTRLVLAKLRSVATVVFCGRQGKPRIGDCLPGQAGRRADQPRA